MRGVGDMTDKPMKRKLSELAEVLIDKDTLVCDPVDGQYIGAVSKAAMGAIVKPDGFQLVAGRQAGKADTVVEYKTTYNVALEMATVEDFAMVLTSLIAGEKEDLPLASSKKAKLDDGNIGIGENAFIKLWEDKEGFLNVRMLFLGLR
jgi:hypothetical protein